MNLLYKINEIIADAEFKFEDVRDGKKDGVLGVYKAVVKIGEEDFEIGIRKTLAGTKFYYIKPK